MKILHIHAQHNFNIIYPFDSSPKSFTNTFFGRISRWMNELGLKFRYNRFCHSHPIPVKSSILMQNGIFSIDQILNSSRNGIISYIELCLLMGNMNFSRKMYTTMKNKILDQNGNISDNFNPRWKFKNVNTSFKQYVTKCIKMKYEHSNSVNIFTDGSFDGKKAGYAVVFNTVSPYNEYMRVPRNQSAFHAELYAIFRALCKVHFDIKVTIHTDNKACVFICNTLARHKNHDICGKFKYPNLCFRIWSVIHQYEFLPKFQHVKAHSGILLNEVADTLAKKGTTFEVNFNPDYFMYKTSFYENVSIEDGNNGIIETGIRKKIKHIFKMRNISLLTQTKQGKWFNNGTNTFCNKFMKISHKFSERKKIIISKLRLNIQPSYYNLYKRDEYMTPLCQLCQQDEETNFHILLECSAISSERVKFLQKFKELFKKFNKKVEKDSKINLWFIDKVIDSKTLIFEKNSKHHKDIIKKGCLSFINDNTIEYVSQHFNQHLKFLHEWVRLQQDFMYDSWIHRCKLIHDE
jgi:ribonuclease HI